MDIRVLSGADVRRAVDMPAAIEAMREAFVALSAGRAVAPVRLALESDRGTHLFMPGHLRERGSLGAKIVSVNPDNPDRGLPVIHAVVLLVDPPTGRARALMDGTWITALRTGAVGGLAADLLARPEARVLTVFGAGVQARTQVAAVRCVRTIEEVRIVARTRASAERLAEEIQDVEVRVMADRRAALEGADIVVTATDSATPVFDGRDIAPGTHVTGVGSFTPAMREVDTVLVGRARVFVDQRDAALEEAGDLAGPIADGDLTADVIVGEIGAVAAGTLPGRTSPDDITFFKSVGNAVQDVAVAARVLDVAERDGLGAVFSLR
ncbi:MAG: hypothetical protein RJQ04_03880 [Longimicrobiales bacterium]